MEQSEATRAVSVMDPTPDAAHKKVYQRPVLRVFGSVHRMTQGSGGMSTDSATNMTKMLTGGGSDRTIKENIVRIGEHPLGVSLYLFDYKIEYQAIWGQGRQFGVMADEIEAVMPKAVSTHADGYKLVDYAMLGISRGV